VPSSLNHPSLAHLDYASSNHTGFLEDADLAVGTRINSAASKSVPVAADEFGYSDSEASNTLKKLNLTELIAAVGGGGGGVAPWTDTFDNSADWGAASGGLYSIQFTHSLNETAIHIQVFDTDTDEMVYPEEIVIDDADNVTIKVSETPDNRFNGIIIILSSSASLFASKVDANVAIVAGTKTKITYDAKGLVTVGDDATTADIADSANKRYVTDAQLVVIGNTSNTNSGNETATSIGALINAADPKNPPVDADMLGLMDSAASNILTKLSWANVKATLKTYFDTLYQAILTAANLGAFINGLTTKATPVAADQIVLMDSADSNNAKKVAISSLNFGSIEFISEQVASASATIDFTGFINAKYV
jgi:hypothetical protein